MAGIDERCVLEWLVPLKLPLQGWPHADDNLHHDVFLNVFLMYQIIPVLEKGGHLGPAMAVYIKMQR